MSSGIKRPSELHGFFGIKHKTINNMDKNIDD